jgi:hypothetical protein
VKLVRDGSSSDVGKTPIPRTPVVSCSRLTSYFFLPLTPGNRLAEKQALYVD